MSALVHARGWGWKHSGRKAWAVRGLDLRIEAGERVLLLGASGAGKSTLLAGLAGVLGGDEDGTAEGSLEIGGRPATDARGRTGLVLQDPDSQMIMARIGDDTAFGCENLGLPREQIWQRVREAHEAVRLRLPIDHPTDRLSGGQKQRLALAGALAMRPELLLLDEPTANLDPGGVIEVRDAVARSLDDADRTAVIVEHRIETWLDVITRVVVLDPGGGVLADGGPAEVLERQGEWLADQGIWVPGREPRHPPAEIRSGGELLRARDLSVERTRDDIVAAGIGLTIREGAALAITGPNGSGKTTLALTLGGLIPPAGGVLTAASTLADGAGDTPVRWRSRQLLTRIGSVLQNPEHQLLAATVRDELSVGPRALGIGDIEVARRVDELLERLTLTALAGAHPFTLSGGQKRRLSVGTALATAPKVLVLDEPTFGQDSRTWLEVVRLLDEARQHDRAVVAVTHDERVIDALAATRLALPEART